MTELTAWVAVFVTAATPWLEVLLVVPAAILGGLPAVPTVVVAAAGNIATLVPLVYGGDRVRSWLRGRRAARKPDGGLGEAADGDNRRGARARLLFERWGLPGLAALGPLLTGVHVAAVVALAAGAPRRPTAAWLSVGVVVWAVLAAVVTVAGLDLL